MYVIIDFFGGIFLGMICMKELMISLATILT